jgi:hypothetical protein
MAQHDAANPGRQEATPLQISEQFVKAYYRALQSKPTKLNLFYKDHSLYTRHLPFCDSAPPVTVRGGIAIKDKINEQLDGPCEVSNLSYCHQLSHDGSLVLSVAGQLESAKGVRRFAQTFMLACADAGTNAYYIYNDICCFFDANPVPVNEAVEQAPPVLEVPPPVEAPKPVEQLAETAAPEAIPEPDPEPEPEPEVQTVQEHEPEPAPAEEAPAVEEVPAPEPEAAPMKPSSWAGIAGLKCPKPVEPEKPPPRRTPGPPGSAGIKPAENETSNAQEPQEDSTASVFVSGVPNGCKKENLEEVMSRYGDVKKIVINPDKHYAIVDFSNAEAAQKALESPAPKYDGSILKVPRLIIEPN